MIKKYRKIVWLFIYFSSILFYFDVKAQNELNCTKDTPIHWDETPVNWHQTHQKRPVFESISKEAASCWVSAETIFSDYQNNQNNRSENKNKNDVDKDNLKKDNLNNQNNLNKNLIFIDVRDTAHAQNNPLKGALQIPLSDVQSKAFLKTEKTVLIGHAWDSQNLTDACLALKQAGFASVHVLRGGVRSWLKANQTMLGETRSENILSNELNAADFLRGTQQGSLRIVSVGLNAQQEEKLFKTPEIHLQTSSDTNRIFEQLLVMQNDHRHIQNPSQFAIVIVANNELVQRQLQINWFDFINKNKSKNQTKQENINTNSAFSTEIVWLSGGFAAYEKHIEQQKSIAQNANRSLLRPCGS